MRSRTAAVQSAASEEPATPELVWRPEFRNTATAVAALRAAFPDEADAKIGGRFADMAVTNQWFARMTLAECGEHEAQHQRRAAERTAIRAGVTLTDAEVAKTVRRELAVLSGLDIRVRKVLSYKMPNGKQLGDCTGRELIGFGGWFTQIGQHVSERAGPDQTVREAGLTAAEVVELARPEPPPV